jgi:hypothetical protein
MCFADKARPNVSRRNLGRLERRMSSKSRVLFQALCQQGSFCRIVKYWVRASRIEWQNEGIKYSSKLILDLFVQGFEKSEDPIYVLENNIPIDTQHYLENQLSKVR